MADVTINIIMDELPTPHVDDDAIGTWIEARLNDARNHFIRSVSRGTGSGRIYRRRGARGRVIEHQASAPGEFPVTDTGRLVNSVNYEMRGPREGVLFSDVVYAGYLAETRQMLTDALEQVLGDRPRTDVLARSAKIE